MTRDEANIVIDVLEVMEEMTNHQAVVAEMQGRGYTEAEVDDALKALGTVAHRDYGWL